VMALRRAPGITGHRKPLDMELANARQYGVRCFTGLSQTCLDLAQTLNRVRAQLVHRLWDNPH